MTKLLILEDVSKSFEAPVANRSLVKWLISPAQQPRRVSVLKSISLEVKSGESIGIIGRNSSGKSTLLKIMAGILRPSSGTIKTYSEVLPLFSWEACFIDDLDVLDNLSLLGAMFGIPNNELLSIIPKLVAAESMQERLRDQMRTISPGMRARLALSLADLAPAKIIIIDETLSAGDNEFRHICAKMLKDWKRKGRSIIHVSHDMELIKSLSDRWLLMVKGTLRELNLKELNDLATSPLSIQTEES